jgi:hypothetical protein
MESSPAAMSRRSATSVVREDTRSMCFTSAGESPWIQIGYVVFIQRKSSS